MLGTPTLPGAAVAPNPIILVAPLASDLSYTDSSGGGTLAHAGAITYEDRQLMLAGSTAIHIDSDGLDPLIGSIAFRFRRKADSGTVEYILTCGTELDDRLRIYVNDDDYLYVAWDSGGALPQYVISPDTITVDTEYFLYTYWDGIIIGMSIDNGAMVVGARDVPINDWGTDNLVIQAT